MKQIQYNLQAIPNFPKPGSDASEWYVAHKAKGVVVAIGSGPAATFSRPHANYENACWAAEKIIEDNCPWTIYAIVEVRPRTSGTPSAAENNWLVHAFGRDLGREAALNYPDAGSW